MSASIDIRSRKCRGFPGFATFDEAARSRTISAPKQSLRPIGPWPYSASTTPRTPKPECSRWRSLYLHPAAADPGVNISSKGNDDLTELAAVLQIAVHIHHIVELECTIDDRLERATREALGDVLHCELPGCLVARY
jgi:hypothetical protein